MQVAVTVAGGEVKRCQVGSHRGIAHNITINDDGLKHPIYKNKEKKFLSNLGEEIGLLFQFADDFLDIKGSKKLVGKPDESKKIRESSVVKQPEEIMWDSGKASSGRKIKFWDSR